MFCSNCGAEARGNFCWQCGAPLNSPSLSSPSGTQDWSQEIRYEKLIHNSEVRDIIMRHETLTEKSLSGEEFLAFFDKVVPLGFSLEKLGRISHTISTQIGVKTGKERSEILQLSPGTAMVAALCSLARHGQMLRQVRQYEDGCLLEADIPSDMWSLKGTMYIRILKDNGLVRVDATTKITGQLFDWGKSKRYLDTLFADIKATPV